jgi:hypothetical protein
MKTLTPPYPKPARHSTHLHATATDGWGPPSTPVSIVSSHPQPHSRPLNSQALWVVIAAAMLGWGIVHTSNSTADAAPSETAESLAIHQHESERILSSIAPQVLALGGTDADADQEMLQAHQLMTQLLSSKQDWSVVRDGLREFSQSVVARYSKPARG